MPTPPRAGSTRWAPKTATCSTSGRAGSSRSPRVVPANAGTHNHKCVLSTRLWPQPRATTRAWGDGVDGSLRHQLCQNEVVAISDKGAVREADYPHWHGYVEAFFSAARGGCRRAG